MNSEHDRSSSKQDFNNRFHDSNRSKTTINTDKTSSSNYQGHHMHQYKKLQNYEDSMKFKRNIINEVIQLIKEKDHNSLAYIARTCGIPPQLRHLVWPIMLKYHPFVISPNIMTNTLEFNIHHDEINNKDEHDSPNDRKKSNTSTHSDHLNNEHVSNHNLNWNYKPETKDKSEILKMIQKDINKYIMVEHKDQDLEQIVTDCVLKFLAKWGKIFKYESGLTWVCLSLMEWCSPYEYIKNESCLKVLPGRSFYRSTHGNSSKKNHKNDSSKEKSQLNSSNIETLDKISRNLFLDYPMTEGMKELYENSEYNMLNSKTNIFALFEKTLLVFLHSPDLKSIIINKESRLSQDYSPVISGGDYNFNQNLFYKIFEDCFPDLYQSFQEQLSDVMNTSQNTWISYWIKFGAVRTFNKSDRARLWDMMFGWRAHPTNLDFFLKYKNDNLKYTHFYNNEIPMRWTVPPETGELTFKQQIDKYCNLNEDYFWFPDLSQMKLSKSTLDSYIFQELLKRNQQDGDSGTDLDADTKIENLDKKTEVLNSSKRSNSFYSYSLIDLHTQQIFICLTILQKNEFKLLEYEEREVLEFLNNVPILSKYDDLMYKNISQYNFELQHSLEFRNGEISDRESLYSMNSETEISNLLANSNRLEILTSADQFYSNLLTVTSSSNNLLSSSHFSQTPGFIIPGGDTDNESLASDLIDDIRSDKLLTPVKSMNLRNLQSLDHPMSLLSRPPSVQTKSKHPQNLFNNVKSSTGSRPGNKKIEFGTDDKTLHSFNEILSGSGDIWRKWAYHELEQSNVN